MIKIVLKGGEFDGLRAKAGEFSGFFTLNHRRYRNSREIDPGGRYVFVYAPRRPRAR